jgi:hypothetical protein
MRYQQIIPLFNHLKPKDVVVCSLGRDLATYVAKKSLKHENEATFTYVGDVPEGLDKDLESLEGSERLTATFLPKLGEDKVADVAVIADEDPETLRNNFERLKGSKAIIFDNYKSEGGGPVNELVEGLSHVIAPQEDPSKHGRVKLAVYPSDVFPGNAKLQIQTQNCVPDQNIQANIKYAMTLHDNWIKECEKHDLTAIMVSGGPTFRGHIPEIKTLRRKRNHKIICVKHSHDALIEAGVIPWACMLLDPRNHVQDFIENPHPDVIYFTASMCHPTTLDRLLDREATVWGYHALVGAGEDKTLPEGHILIGGGSTSAVRGISVLHSLGFRKFRLYGYDSCYLEPEKLDRSETDRKGRQKYYDVTIEGRQFVTDPELIAQAQDFDKLLQQGRDLDIEVIGDGVVSHIWNVKRRILPSMEDVLNE